MTLKLYTRRGCGLCEEAEEMLAEMLSEIDLIDVDKDPAAARLYGLRVPVLTRGDDVLIEGRFTEVAVATAVCR